MHFTEFNLPLKTANMSHTLFSHATNTDNIPSLCDQNQDRENDFEIPQINFGVTRNAKSSFLTLILDAREPVGIMQIMGLDL